VRRSCKQAYIEFRIPGYGGFSVLEDKEAADPQLRALIHHAMLSFKEKWKLMTIEKIRLELAEKAAGEVQNG
jgi:hypothetical protein